MRRGVFLFALGLVAGALLFGGGTAAAGTVAELSPHPIYVDGRQVSMSAYQIAGSNYVKLRDIGQAVGFNVYWDGGVYVDSFSPYTGLSPEEGAALPEEQIPLASGPASPEEVEAVRREIVERTNAIREAQGLPALRIDAKTMEAAQVRAEEMAETSVYSHTRPDGRRRTTVTDCPYTTENIHCISDWRLKKRGLAEITVEEWAASQMHLEGILDETRACTGVGVARGVSPSSGLPCWYCVQWFLRDGYTITWVDQPAAK